MKPQNEQNSRQPQQSQQAPGQGRDPRDASAGQPGREPQQQPDRRKHDDEEE